VLAFFMQMKQHQMALVQRKMNARQDRVEKRDSQESRVHGIEGQKDHKMYGQFTVNCRS
jgi:hypothetical protein